MPRNTRVELSNSFVDVDHSLCELELITEFKSLLKIVFDLLVQRRLFENRDDTARVEPAQQRYMQVENIIVNLLALFIFDDELYIFEL